MRRVTGIGGIFWLAQLRAEGVEVDPPVEESEFGRFGWVMDPEGNRVELWEPPGSGAP
jgi:predicted enzyme related to lactoylglutathione lyase